MNQEDKIWEYYSHSLYYPISYTIGYPGEKRVYDKIIYNEDPFIYRNVFEFSFRESLGYESSK